MTSLICAACGENLSVKSALEMSLRRDFQALIGVAKRNRVPDAALSKRSATPKFRRVAATTMHLKRYQIDGRLLRSGAGNFSASGLKPGQRFDRDREQRSSGGSVQARFGGAICHWFATGENRLLGVDR